MLQMQTAMNHATSQLMNYFIFPPLADQYKIKYLMLTISRNNIVADTLNQLSALNTHDLKKPLKVWLL